jgi:hypothetical protein
LEEILDLVILVRRSFYVVKGYREPGRWRIVEVEWVGGEASVRCTLNSMEKVDRTVGEGYDVNEKRLRPESVIEVSR